MRTLLILFICIPLCTIAQSPDKDIIGTWQGFEGETEAIFVFNANGDAFMGNGKQLVGGKEHYIQGKKVSITFTKDTSKKPMHLDLIIAYAESKEQMIIPMIFEFIDKNTIKILGGEEQHIRPTYFNSDAIVFKRMTE